MWLLMIAAALSLSRVAGAQKMELGATLGYAEPVGSAERGSRVADTTFGQVPVALDGAYRLTGLVGVVARLQYGVAIPTQCASASECEASLGSDVVMSLGARFRLPRLIVDASVGYEWLTTRLADGDATSTRAYHGPALLAVEVVAPFALGKGWTLDPALGASVGTFTSYALETNALSPSGTVPERAWHASSTAPSASTRRAHATRIATSRAAARSRRSSKSTTPAMRP